MLRVVFFFKYLGSLSVLRFCGLRSFWFYTIFNVGQLHQIILLHKLIKNKN